MYRRQGFRAHEVTSSARRSEQARDTRVDPAAITYSASNFDVVTLALKFLPWALFVLTLALGIRILVDRVLDVPYSVLLIVAGVAISVLPIELGIRLSEDVLMAVVLPAILFEGAAALNHAVLRENWGIPFLLIVLGIPLAVGLLGIASTVLFGLPLLVSLVLAAIIVPTDPVAVLSLFEEIEAPAHLTTIIESESLFNDGVSVTIFAVLLSLLADGATLGSELPIADLVGELLLVGIGGFLVGGALGYAARRVARWIRERMTVLLVTLLVAYGSYLLAEVVLGVSGILATVGAGLFIETTNDETGLDRQTTTFVRDAWEASAFLLTTFVYVLIGAQVPFSSVIQHAPAVLVTAVLVLLVRAVVVTVTISAANLVVTNRVPIGYQYILVWGGLHTVVPVALVLGLPGWVPYREFMEAVVFGVAIVGAIGQGSVFPYVLRIAGIRDRPSWVDSPSGS